MLKEDELRSCADINTVEVDSFKKFSYSLYLRTFLIQNPETKKNPEFRGFPILSPLHLVAPHLVDKPHLVDTFLLL